MSVKKRILMIRLMNHIEQNKNLAKKLGITISFKKA